MTRDRTEDLFNSLQRLFRYLRSGTFGDDSQPITRVQWMILRHLFRQGERSINELAQHLNVRSSTMSQMIDRLEKVSLVYRSVNEQDLRIKTVRLTDQGLSLVQQVETRWLKSLDKAFVQLSEDEREMMVHLLKKMTRDLP
jgi:DNA-binding MarR family transcriptional regulator